jgi:hypothetical protein
MALKLEPNEQCQPRKFVPRVIGQSGRGWPGQSPYFQGIVQTVVHSHDTYSVVCRYGYDRITAVTIELIRRKLPIPT